MRTGKDADEGRRRGKSTTFGNLRNGQGPFFAQKPLCFAQPVIADNERKAFAISFVEDAGNIGAVQGKTFAHVFQLETFAQIGALGLKPMGNILFIGLPLVSGTDISESIACDGLR